MSSDREHADRPAPAEHTDQPAPADPASSSAGVKLSHASRLKALRESVELYQGQGNFGRPN